MASSYTPSETLLNKQVYEFPCTIVNDKISDIQVDPNSKTNYTYYWSLYFDGSSCKEGADAGCVITILKKKNNTFEANERKIYDQLAIAP